MQDPRQKPTNVRWAVFTLACGTSWLLYLHRYTFALIKPQIAEQWGLGKDQLGLLDSAFALAYAVFQFPLGVTADVLGVRLVLTGLILVWSVGLAMHAWAPTVRQLWYARVVLGIGQSAAFATVNRIARLWFPPSIRTTLQGMAGILAGRIGGLSAYLLFGYLLLGVLELDWRTAVTILAALGVAHALAFCAVFRDAPGSHPGVNQAEALLIAGTATADPAPGAQAHSRMTVGRMLRGLSPRGLVNLAALNVQTILSTFADNIYSNWIPLFLVQVYAFDAKQMGIYSALPLLGGAVAGLVGGVLNDLCIWLTGNRRWSRSGVAAAGKGMAAVLLFAALAWYDHPYVFCAMLFFVKLFGDWSLTTAWGVVADIGGRATASVFAFNNTVAGIGAIAAPAAFGWLAHHYGWRIVFITAATTYALCAASWLVINCTIPIVRHQQPQR